MANKQWRCYSSKFEDEIASVLVDIAALPKVGDPDSPCCLWVSIDLKSLAVDGFPDGSEEAILTQIEDSLTIKVASPLRALYVGRITTLGRREFYYYAAPTRSFELAVSKVMEEYIGYRHTCGAKDDPSWSYYLETLYPSHDQLDNLENTELIGVLTRNGDSLTVPRPVDHYAYFASQVEADAFVKDVVQERYTVIKRTRRNDSGNRTFGVVFQRSEVPTLATINRVMKELRALATSRGGEYDGWETEIVPPNRSL